MLNEHICKSYYSALDKLTQSQGVRTLVKGQDASASYQGTASLLEVDAADFIANPDLQEEVFGPASLVVKCNNKEELLQCLHSMHGQLTGTVFGTNNDVREFKEAVDSLTGKVGRLLFNGVPTGVEVCYAMVHGGPFPATTDARTTSVGTDAIKRFVRPVCFQDCPEEFLPDALKSDNPLNIMRRVNGAFTRDSL
jgi:NADP-dependent aldehyde dehydrogenase